MTTTNITPKYFDLHVEGCGYLSRARQVHPKKAAPYWSVAITACRGEAGDKQKTYFDVNVVGEQAQALIAKHADAINHRERRVFVSFKLGDIYPETFVYGETSPKKGETGVMLKGRLLQLRYLAIDGQAVYRLTAETDPASETPAEPEGPAGDREPATQATEPAPVASDLPVTVKLDSAAPDFEHRKAELEAQGYRFDPECAHWYRPVVQAA